MVCLLVCSTCVYTRLENYSKSRNSKDLYNFSSQRKHPQMQLTVNVKCWGLAITLDILNTVCHTPPTPLLLVVSQSTIVPFPSGWLDCRSACCSIWPWGPSARAVWDLWCRLPAQEEGEGHADCKWQWMVEWIVNVHMLDMAGFV